MSREIHLVYHGAGIAGCFTNITWLFDKYNVKWDFNRNSDLDWGKIVFKMEKEIEVKLYSTPTALAFDPTRIEILKNVDAVVFVADSQIERIEHNKAAFDEMKFWLEKFEKRIPFVIQYNKRDLPNLLSIEELEKEINTSGVQYFESVAVRGVGVIETFEGILKKLNV